MKYLFPFIFCSVLVAPGFSEENITVIHKLVSPYIIKAVEEYESGEKKPSPFSDTNSPAIQMYLENAGIDFKNEGSSASIDKQAKTMTVINTKDQQELVEAYFQVINTSLDKSIELRFEVYLVDQLDAIELMEAERKTTDDTELVSKLRVKAKRKDGAKLVTAPMITARSGNRAKVEKKKEYEFIGWYEAKDGQDMPGIDAREVGTIFEVDPVLGADDMTIDLNLGLVFSEAEPEFRKNKMKGPVSGEMLEYESIIIEQSKLTTQVTILDGQTSLVGTVSSTKEEGKLLMYLLNAKIKRTF